MSMFWKSLFLVFASLLCLRPALADEPTTAAADAAIPGLTKTLSELLPGVAPDGIRPAPVAGLYEVMYGANVFYMTPDGRYLMQGAIIDMKTREDLTEPRRAEGRLRTIDAMGEDSMLTFGPETSKHTITVFTDIDCPYCRKLHQEVDEMNALGIRVRYLFYPRAGVGSGSYKKAVSVWCAENRNQALTDAKNGVEVAEKDCENPVKDHMLLGEMIGVRGTPAIVTESGELVPGYVPAKRLAAMLEQDKGADAGKAEAPVAEKVSVAR
jgi:thiol:disulfide interchange protein DsbC